MIEVKGLRKSFRTGRGGKKKTVEAVNGIDLSVAECEIFGFLGPNGAGKTTTLRMLATLITPEAGEATVAGVNLRSDPGGVRRQIGYVAQGGGTWDDVSAREELVLQSRMHGIRKAEAQQRADAAVDAFQLTEFADRHCKTYSGGQRRRLDIALGCVHQPKVLFLDEPTANLDPPSRARVWEEVRRLRADGMTIFLTTHYLEEADALCDRIAIIDYGRLVAEGTPTELKREISGDVVLLGLNGSTGDAAKALTGRSYVLDTQEAEDGLRLYVDAGETAIPQIMRELAGAGIVLETISLHRPSLDDVFLTKTGRTLT